uniref:E3 ubiquitin-protein ligase RNF26 n=1 Tax=Cyanoderma ruficeps TaxID=181631 RepID=A0A8C3QVV7_9PASS
MDVLFALLRGLRLLLDLLLLVLDLNFFLVSSLVSALLWLLAAASSLPAAAAAAVVACWDALVLLRGCCGAMEGMRAAGHLVSHLVSHLALRARELAQRGLGAVLGCGQALCRQLCEALAIGTSLLMYLVNSLVNVCLIGAQNLFTLLGALWDSLAGPVVRVADLLAAFLAHVSSGAIAVSILLWSPCQMAFELLCSATDLFISVFFVNVYGLGLLLLIVVVGALVFNPGLLWTLTGYLLGYFHTLPSFRRLQRDVWRLYQVAVLTLGVAMTSQPWRRLVDWILQVTDWSLQVTNWSRGGRMMNQGSDQRRAVGAPRAPAAGRVTLGRLPAEQEEKQQLNNTGRNAEGTPDNDPWALLKEQEERKKCVICQDQAKTVLLLPCRHLCLCQECTEVLLQQDIYQRNCPLCRQVILQTLNVYL